MRRREFIAGLGSAAACAAVARAQQPAMPVVGFITAGSLDTSALNLGAFRASLAKKIGLQGQTCSPDCDRLPT
jgi:putative tryptophan/tyrosine transport system substrate-binding protein